MKTCAQPAKYHIIININKETTTIFHESFIWLKCKFSIRFENSRKSYLHITMITSIPFRTLSTHVSASVFILFVQVIQLTAGAEVVLFIFEGTRARLAVVRSASQGVPVKSGGTAFASFADGVMLAQAFPSFSAAGF